MPQSTIPVTIYTDGACSGNPGRGGYGVILMAGDRRKELSQGYRLTTNNRMELMAAIAGLRELKFSSAVTIYTDSRYVLDGIERGWAKNWRANGWRRKTGEPALNADLWAQLLDLCDAHQVQFAWVRGHTDDVNNEYCDRLAVAATRGNTFIIDQGYEQVEPTSSQGD